MSDERMKSLTREELYQAVWAEPISVLAPRYGLSGRGLGKLCARHRIPVPPRGYWARKEHGYAVKQPVLPRTPLNSPQCVLHVATQTDPVAEEEGPLPPEIEFEDRPENHIQVDPTERLAESVVLSSLKQLAQCEADERGIVTPPADCLNVRVSAAMRDRALRVVQTLERALSIRGHHLKLVTSINTARGYYNPAHKITKTLALVLEEEIEFGIEERSVTVPPSRRRDKSPRRFAAELEPNGKMEFEILTWSPYGRRRWRDGKRTIEEQLNSIVVGFLETAFSLKERRAEEERQRIEKIAAAERQAELERLRNEEIRRITIARRQISGIEEASRINLLIEAIRAAAVSEGVEIEPGSSLHSWIDWLSGRAAALNPLPRILAGDLSGFETDNREEDRKPPYNYQTHHESRPVASHWPFQHWSQRTP